MLVKGTQVANYINNLKYCQFHLYIFFHYMFLSILI